MKIILEQNKSEFLGALHFKVKKVYRVKNYTLRAKLLIESPLNCETHIISINTKKQSVISATWGSVLLTGIDLDSQSIQLEVNFRK
jgi:hypothetical protein